MIYSLEIAKQLANYLLECEAVRLQPSQPFTWASGWKSPIYCDNRKTLSFPLIRSFIKESFATLILDKFCDIDRIGGVATGGIAHGALVADVLKKPFLYIRSESKSHGLENQIEGIFEKNDSILVVEDLISTGGSSLNAVKALREKNCRVAGMTAIFTYQFSISEEKFAAENCTLFTLTNYEVLINCALERNYISQNELELLKKWREKPEIWGK